MLKQILQKYVDQPVKMVVYNSKSRTTRGQSCERQINVVPVYYC